MKSNLVFAIAFTGALLIPSALFGQWYLFFIFLFAVIALVVAEIVSIQKTGETVSYNFWQFSKENKTKAIIILAGIITALVVLIWHLSIGF